MSNRVPDEEPLLDLQEEDGIEHLDSQVQKAQEQLLQLKRQQDLIEKQKRELEELSRRQELLQQGRAEMIEQLSRALVVLERETYDAQKRVEQLRGTHESFRQHLEVIEAINPKSWDPANIQRELNRALGSVEDARAEFARGRAVLNAASDAGQEVLPSAAQPELAEAGFGPAPLDFVSWLKCGFAFTLPLLLAALMIAAAVYFAR